MQTLIKNTNQTKYNNKGSVISSSRTINNYIVYQIKMEMRDKSNILFLFCSFCNLISFSVNFFCF